MRRLVLVLAPVTASAALWASPVAADSGVVVVGHGSTGSSSALVGARSSQQAGGILVIRTSPQLIYVARVRCVRGVGDHVLVGGSIVWSTNRPTIGNTAMIAVRDDPAGDALGVAFSNSGLDQCPVFDIPLHPLTSGDFRTIRF